MRGSETGATFVMKRRFDPAEPELMDRPQPISAELERDLANLRQLNRFFGSYRLVRYFLRRWIKPGESLRMADLATGSGDIPRLVIDFARSNGANVRIDAVDQQSSTLAIARRLSVGYPEISYCDADILDWEPSEKYDIVLCSLALHHFSESDAARLLRRARKLSKKSVLVSDLRRGLLAIAGVYVLTALIFREPMTRYDGRVSAERAFSFREMRDLAVGAGWEHFGHAKFAFARQAIWIE
jgi:2-polyprenyl-3-methyl-5-hydroxy-6-metoxy-1,4-benzoquinol methylase